MTERWVGGNLRDEEEDLFAELQLSFGKIQN